MEKMKKDLKEPEYRDKDLKEKEENEKYEKPTEDYYSKEERQQMMEEDEIEPGEAGFMEGYDNPDLMQCGKCGEEVNLEKAIEKEINGKTYLFCSEKCLEEFEKEKE